MGGLCDRSSAHAGWIDEAWRRSGGGGLAASAGNPVVSAKFLPQPVWLQTVSDAAKPCVHHPCGRATAVRLRKLRNAERLATTVRVADRENRCALRHAPRDQRVDAFQREERSSIGAHRDLTVPTCSPLSCRSRIGELLPFTPGLVRKILVSAGFVAQELC